MSSIGYNGCYQDIATHVPLKQTNQFYFVITGGSGAVGTITDPAKCVASVVRDDTGDYTVTLNTRWTYLLPSVTVFEAGLVCTPTAVTQGAAAANAFSFTVAALDGSATATDPADTKRVQVQLDGSRRAEFTP